VGFFLLAFSFMPGTSIFATNAVAGTGQMGADPPDPYDSPTNGLGSWIWDAKVSDNQTCQLWRSFEIPAGTGVKRARLCMAVDNEFTVFLDGRELGHGDEWRELFVFDLTTLLSPGTHVLAVRAFNSYHSAGMLLGLRVDLSDGHHIEIKSDQNWRVVPNGTKGWEKMTQRAVDWPLATVEAPFGGAPWWTQPDNIDIMPTLHPIRVFFWQTGWFQITLLSVCCLVILISFRLMAQLALHRKERLLLRQERARIAREIHDDIGARMTQLVLHGELAQSELPDGSEMQLQIVQLCEDARGLLSTMDEILWAVNPRRDTLRDFASYVCKYAEDFLKPTQIQCIFEVEPEMSAAALDLPVRRSLLMAIKETLNNAVKYSKASELRLQIQWQGHRLVVVVVDNGQGFDPAVLKSERNGLTNMSQRMIELGGDCVITSQPGKGCKVEFSIPLKRAGRNLWSWLRSSTLFSEQTDDTIAVPANEPSHDHDPTKC
jgi:signal transduction histidine kinase